jgi:hypothetical protein
MRKECQEMGKIRKEYQKIQYIRKRKKQTTTSLSAIIVLLKKWKRLKASIKYMKTKFKIKMY